MNLYQHNELARLDSHIDYETGEINLVEWEASQVALVEKQRAVVAWLKNNDSNINMLDNAIKELTARKKSMQTRHESLKEYLLVNMQANCITEINANDMTFSAKIKKNPPRLIIDDAGKIPNELYIYHEAPPPSVDNAAVKAKLSAGEEVEGARLEQGIRLDIK